MSVDETMKWAAACAESGDSDGELEAYRRADDLGDASAAVLLGNCLRRRGDLDGAKAAYGRAEARGHPEAAMSLANLLDVDLGDQAGAKVAYLRSIEMGSTMASTNLGLMLAAMGDFEQALVHLEHAAADGDSHACWGVGRVQQDIGNLDKAVAAYRQGSDLGHADSAHGLGVVLYDLGDPLSARAAFERSAKLGHDGAQAVANAIESESLAPPSEALPNVGQLWSDVTRVFETLASERQELGRQWITDTLRLQEHQSQLEAIEAAEGGLRKRLEAICSRFSISPFTVPGSNPADPIDGRRGRIPGPVPSEWLEAKSGQTGSWQLATQQERSFNSDLEQAQAALTQAANRMLGGGLRRQGLDALSRAKQRVDALALAVRPGKDEVRGAQTSRSVSARKAGVRSREVIDPIASMAANSQAHLPSLLQPWSSPAWATWNADDESNLGLRLAYGGVLSPKDDSRLGDNSQFGSELQVPWGFALHDSWWLQHDGAERSAVHGFIRSMMLRQLISARPGEVKFCVFDPVGLGQSAGELLDLAEYDAELIGGKIWSSSQDLEARLLELSAHIELVIQKYLRTTYDTIDDFNEAAGEVAEPYRALVLFDCPTGLTADSAARLQSIVENGPRCGVFTLIAADSSVQTPYGVDVQHISQSMRRLNLYGEFVETINGYQLETALQHDVLPEGSEIAKRVIDGVGRASISRAESTITFEDVFAMYGSVASRGLRPELGTAVTNTHVSNPETWWGDDSTRGLFAPIGQKGARDVAVLGFDSGDHAGALLVGRPGSGKSTLLHAYVGGLTTLYGPDELELYLVDFKEGVEFKAYAEEQLPHAKVIAIESDREFGLSVLESLQAEIASRAEVLRATGGRQAGMQGLREATGDTIPRILLVFDEFQVLFARNDKVGLAAADLLESIIRQGRGFGVHVLLGSQSLAGLDALGAHVLQLLPVRILLPAAESDARKVLGDSNNAGDYLTSHGEGVLNTSGGAVEANQRFKGALLTEPDRIARLQVLRDKASKAGFTRTPLIFEGNSLVSLDSQNPHQFSEELAATGTHPVRVRFGAPMTVGEIGDLVLSREAGANVLAIARSGADDGGGVEPAGGSAYGLVAAAVASAAMTTATIDVIDFMPNDDGLDELFEPLLESRRISLKRRRAFPDVLAEYTDEVSERVEHDDSNRTAKLLFLFGVHRARDLDSELGSLDVDTELVEKLETVMRDGPEVGVHVWLWSDSVTGASRRLSPRMMREVAWRIAGKMSADDSQTFISTGAAADLRASQLLMVNEDRGTSIRVTAFSPPSLQWVTEVTAAITSE